MLELNRAALADLKKGRPAEARKHLKVASREQLLAARVFARPRSAAVAFIRSVYAASDPAMSSASRNESRWWSRTTPTRRSGRPASGRLRLVAAVLSPRAGAAQA